MHQALSDIFLIMLVKQVIC